MFVPRSVSRQVCRGKEKTEKQKPISGQVDQRRKTIINELCNTTDVEQPILKRSDHSPAPLVCNSQTGYSIKAPQYGVQYSSSSTVQTDIISAAVSDCKCPGESQQAGTAVIKDWEQQTSDREDEDDSEPVVSFSKYQRWPVVGEPVCVVCGRYGAYIVDQTDKDICSLECKAKHLHQLGLPLESSATMDVQKLEVEKNKLKEAENKELKVEPEKREFKVEVANVENELEAEDESVWAYTEHADIVIMTTEQVAAIRNKYAIKVKGDEAPRPITQFVHLGLPNKVMSNLTDEGYNTPTPVQMQTIPAALSGRDLLVCAGTGSGKTLSFLLPVILNMLSMTTPQQRLSNPRVLILAPTRELAMQIEQQAKDIIKGVPMMRTALIVGGVPIAQQLHRLHSGVQIIIATPARLNDIIENHSSDVELMDIDAFVVDEVDCLLHMGFETQVHQIEELLPGRRQNLMFSATIPHRIEKMSKKMMDNPLFICIGEPSVPCDSIKHTVIWVEEKAKRKKLIALLNDQRHFRPPAIVFVNSKMGTLLLADAINKICTQLSAVGIHGDMAQERRSEIVQGCLEGKYSVVVATNVLGRGVDLVNVKQVIVFDMPRSVTEFIHQVGRAGRLGSPGTAFSFINNENKVVFMDLVTLLEPQGVQLPPQLVNSPHLKIQQDKRKRKSVPKMFGGAGEEERVLLSGGPVKKQREDSKRDFYHDKESLLDLIRANSRKSSYPHQK